MTTLEELAGTQWSGKGELWLDPEGNEAKVSECTIAVHEGPRVRYTWTYDGKPQQGELAWSEDGVDFSDSWHQPEVKSCKHVADSWALIDVSCTYGAGEGPDWGWRIALSSRPTGELVLQMTNVAPWGEDGRAVRMVCTRS